MPLVQVIVVGLAIWRVSAMLVYEDGPWAIFERFRTLVGIPPEGGRIEGFLPALLSCVWCTSVWLAPLMWSLWYVHWAIPALLATSAVAIALERYVRP